MSGRCIRAQSTVYSLQSGRVFGIFRKAALKRTQSKRFAKFNGLWQSRQRLECACFSTAFPQHFCLSFALNSPPHLAPILAHRLTDLAFEKCIEVFGILKPGLIGDLIKWRIGFGQQLFHALQANPKDLLFRRSAQCLHKASLQFPPGHAGHACHLLDPQRLVRMLAHMSHHAPQTSIRDGKDVRGMSPDHGQWRDQDGFGRNTFAGHHGIQDGCSLIADLPRVLRNAREWWIAQFTENGVVVHADHGHFIGDIHARPAAGADDLLAAGVIAGH